MSQLLDRTIELLVDERFDVDRDGDGRASFTVDLGPSPWTVRVAADDQRQWLVVRSVFPMTVSADRRGAMSIFVTRANFGLIIGNFEFDLDGGEVRYTTSIDVNGLEPTRELIRPILMANISTMHRYLPGAMAVLDGADAVSAIADVRNTS